MLDLQNRVAFVTGASRGIGKAIAKELALQGAIVIGSTTQASLVEKITEELSTIRPTSSGYLLNVNNVTACEQAIADIMAQHQRLDILVNNAGIVKDQLALRLLEDDWNAVITTNLNSVFRLSRLSLKMMIKARYGRIINITSVVASMGNPGQANYAAAKAGIEGMSRSLAQEVAGRKITVNCIAPGFVSTDMTSGFPEDYVTKLCEHIPMRRFAQTEEIAYAAAFLASERASYITGSTLHVNGGLYM